MSSRSFRQIVLRSCAAAAVLAFAAPLAAYAQEQTYSFNIPAQDLGSALRAFGRQAHQQIVFDGSVVRGKSSAAVMGGHTAAEAIRGLLVGTGLVARRGAKGEYLVGAADPQSEGTPERRVPETVSEITVTGTKIKGVTPASPVQIITRSDILAGGYSSVGQVLEGLPENFSGGQTPTNIIGNGASGDSYLTGDFTANLRGLGSNSTLSLVNGHRLPSAETGGAADLSIIPLAAVARIEVATDGASAIYGADAVGGVVNTILRTDYDGAETMAYVGVPTNGGGLDQRYSQMLGRSWTSGNVTLAFEHRNQQPVLASQRDFSPPTTVPTDLSPRTNRNSAFLSANQAIGPNASIFAEGLYTSRSNSLIEAGYAGVAASSGKTREYAFTGGVKSSLAGDWTSELATTNSGNRQSASQTVGSSEQLTYAKNQLTSVDMTASGTALDLPWGPVKLAAGAGYRWESLDFNASSPGHVSTYSRSRRVGYVYSETDIPLVRPDAGRTGLHRLNLNLSGRYEGYSEGFSSVVPKISLVYAPLSEVTIKGTWGKSFRAPTLSELYGGGGTGLYPASLFGITSPANATVMYAAGSNINLKPETSKNWTATVEYRPSRIPGLDARLSFFGISYTNRIVFPIVGVISALRDPLAAPYVARSPSSQLQQTLIAQLGGPSNFTGAPYDPANVAALIENFATNALTQTAKGVDLNLKYTKSTSLGTFGFSANASWLSLKQRNTPLSPVQTLSGTLYNPPETKYRAVATWERGGLYTNAAVNYVGSEQDNIAPTPARVGSWTTADLTFGYRDIDAPGPFHGLSASVTVRNLLDRRPPFVRPADSLYQGFAYDTANASPFGRVVAITLSKEW